jgi:hypothetical protein
MFLGDLATRLGLRIGQAMVQRAQHRNARMHDEVTTLGGVDQLLHCQLPVRRVVNLLRQLHNVVRRILERQKRLALRRVYRIMEAGGPWHQANSSAPAGDWDLPVGPVEFEQREGRISRYSSLAVRRAFVAQHAAAAYSAPLGKSPFTRLFDAAHQAEDDGIGLEKWWTPPTEKPTSFTFDWNFGVRKSRFEKLKTRIKVAHISGSMLVPAAADAIGLVQKEITIAQGGFGVLIDGHDDRLDVMEAPTFARCPLTNLSQRFDPRRMVILWVVPF